MRSILARVYTTLSFGAQNVVHKLRCDARRRVV